ncbi:MAG: aminotransferase class I/II-fold pyridoxal phosphate-dependent enzyme [Isosphaeraceae bacterium]
MIRQNWQDLAIVTGVPAFQAMLHVGRPNVGDEGRLLARFREILDRRWFTNDGPVVREFEARIAELADVKHCVAMCNATVALEIASRALGMAGEVVVPSLSFVATAHALQWQGITPLFADITPGTHHIDPDSIERLLTPRTTGIVGVHLWGTACDIEALEDIARRRRLRLMFDAAHAFGCTHRGRPIGGFGEAEVFSFHATKFVNSFEGGAVVTNDDSLAERMRLMRNFGFAGYDRVVHPGTNGKMSEVCAAMGLTSLESLDQIVSANRANYHLYRELLGRIPGLRLYRYDESERCNYQYVVFEVDPVEAGLTRDELIAVLVTENVNARRYFWPGIHRMEPYASYQPNASLLLEETEQVAARLLSLPTGTAIGPDQIRTIASIITTALASREAVRGRLAANLSPASVPAMVVDEEAEPFHPVHAYPATVGPSPGRLVR